MWDESLTMIPKIWESEIFEWEGRFWNVPPRKVLPKPYQKPHPPMWVAALQPATYALAAQKGIGVMALGVSAPSVLEPHIKEYKQKVKEADPVGGFINDRWLSGAVGFCGEDDRSARLLCEKSLKTFFGPDRPYLQDQVNVYETLVAAWGGVPEHLKQNFSRYVKDDAGAENGNSQLQEELDLSGGAALAQKAWAELDADTLCERGVMVAGDPDSCIRALKLHEAAGVDEVQFLMATETVPHEQVMKSIELFGKYVIPAFDEVHAAV
jgi:alkanesulfonate monooxygenase SsuD/methylene tetrahydromethanopterin reductase-like flavin-dependent oxidoreductase (luciferase family)